MTTITAHNNMYNNTCLFTTLQSKETRQSGEYTSSVIHFTVCFNGVHLNILYNEYNW
jgi:hypothetical protein